MTTAWSTLANESYISLTTFRKNGTPVATAVWFAEQDGKLLVYTVADSGKVKRIRNSGAVEVTACDRVGKVHGPTLKGTARLLGPSEISQAEHTLNQKYFLKRIMNIAAKLRPTPRAYIEISPA